ncbi:MAG: hypothetical protein J6J12_09380 [Oscillospiraceae bacterium]|nr:hypothetical protein [Oscillospiraceae bacterium]
MRNTGLSREGLKTIACMTMLIDHIGATLVSSWLLSIEGVAPTELFWLYNILRCIGRMAFPIFCFQLVEGAYYTKNPKKYALRLFIGLLLSEIPFDLAFSHTWLEKKWSILTPLLGVNTKFNSVMMTLLLGFFMIQSMKRVNGMWKGLVAVPFCFAAELLHTDYAGEGILLIALFALVRGQKHQKLLTALGMVALVILGGDGVVFVDNVPIYMDRCKLLALLPIFAYDGRKVSQSKALQWGFYLFYPAHIAILALLDWVIFGFSPFGPG